ncbi:hypothetical protein ACFYTQ_26180 [Nocardia sp. NPDC004068]|uniref:hypothetical protein n=1 Tax=Nocardia sp. NPDC004068 TaxID=3364303 RepID=UPI0036C4FE25
MDDEDDFIDSNDKEYVMSRIHQDHLGDSTARIALAGSDAKSSDIGYARGNTHLYRGICSKTSKWFSSGRRGCGRRFARSPLGSGFRSGHAAPVTWRRLGGSWRR